MGDSVRKAQGVLQDRKIVSGIFGWLSVSGIRPNIYAMHVNEMPC